jgi:hypothetical protein
VTHFFLPSRPTVHSGPLRAPLVDTDGTSEMEVHTDGNFRSSEYSPGQPASSQRPASNAPLTAKALAERSSEQADLSMSHARPQGAQRAVAAHASASALLNAVAQTLQASLAANGSTSGPAAALEAPAVAGGADGTLSAAGDAAPQVQAKSASQQTAARLSQCWSTLGQRSVRWTEYAQAVQAAEAAPQAEPRSGNTVAAPSAGTVGGRAASAVMPAICSSNGSEVCTCV